jgi:hypothetical protein
MTMDSDAAAKDLEFIRSVMARTRRRVDPHAFHFVHWGAIVLVWYPLGNLFALEGRLDLLVPLGIGALLLGSILSGVREFRLRRRPRLEGEDTFLSDQVDSIVAGSLGAAGILSAVGPLTGCIPGPQVPVIWGLAYAGMAWMVGVVYSREYRWAGVFIFAGSLVAMALPDWNGFILGPSMGVGMIVPGLMAERRVRAMAAEPEGDGRTG